MKITTEIEIDWIDEESGLDDAIQEKILTALTRRIETDFLTETGKLMAQAAQRLITAKTELLINTVLEKPVVVSNGWNDKQQFDSIYDMVEQKLSALYQGKLDNKGKCEKDPLLSNIEKNVEQSVAKLLADVQKIIEKHAKEAAAKEVQESELFKTLEKVVTIKTAEQERT